MRLPSSREFLRFLKVEGWTDKDAASGKRTGNHHRYVFTTPTGERLYTRVSHGTRAYQNPAQFKDILRDQLRISEGEFWEAVDKGVPPVRPAPAGHQKARSGGMDGKLATVLIKKVGLAPSELAGMSQEDAVAAWQRWLLENPGG